MAHPIPRRRLHPSTGLPATTGPEQAIDTHAAGGGLRREITIALILKFAALVALYLLFFSPAHRHPADPAARIAGDAPSPALLLSR